MKTNYIKNIGSKLFVCLFVFLSVSAFAQETVKEQTVVEAVTGTFETGTLLQTQNTETAYAKEFEIQVQHRFGLIENGLSDVFGIYSAANIKLGVSYGITSDIMVGYSYVKDFKMQEISGKYRFLKQNEDNSIPVSLAAYGNISFDSRDKDDFGINYQFSDRMSYFGQIIVAHKINDKFSVMLSPSYSHFNKTEYQYEHDKIALTFAARAKITYSLSALIEYDQPLNISSMEEYNDPIDPKSNLSVGVELGTSTHVFQIFASSFNSINPQRNMLFNQNDWTEGEMLLGFNILIRF